MLKLPGVSSCPSLSERFPTCMNTLQADHIPTLAACMNNLIQDITLNWFLLLLSTAHVLLYGALILTWLVLSQIVHFGFALTGGDNFFSTVSSSTTTTFFGNVQTDRKDRC